VSGNHLSILQLDTFALGGLSAAERGAAQAHLDGCEACRSRLQGIAAEREGFDRFTLPKTMPAVVERLRPRPWQELLRGLSPAFALAAACAVLLVLVPLSRTGPGELGIKGGAALQVVARQGARVGPLRAGERLAPGDEIRFVVEPGTRRYLLIVSVDGAGAVSVYEPFHGAASRAISGARVEIPGSIVLDRSPGPERLYALFSDVPIPVADVAPKLQALGQGGAEAIRRGGPLEVPGAEAVSTWFEKGTP
jgi:hypothetical protein